MMVVSSIANETEKIKDVSTTRTLLEKEMSQLNSMKDVLNRSSQVASSMSTILDSFDHRLAKLEMTILPVYQQTGDLQRRQQNTEKTLQALDYVIGFYNVAGDVEGLIRERPASVGIKQYLQAMDKLTSACRYFKGNNPHAIELENVKSLFETGCQQLSVEFRDELKKYHKPLPPPVTLELLELDDSEINEESLSSLELIPVDVRNDLRSIAIWLDLNSSSDRMTVYAKQRAYALSESLKVLRAYQKSNSAERGPAQLSSVGSSNSPALAIRTRPGKFDPSKFKSSKISQKATRVFMKAMTAQSSNIRRTGGAALGYEEGLDEHDVYLYLSQVTALHRLSLCELLLARQLVPPDKVTRTFELIVKDPINDLAVEGESLASQASKSVSRGELQAVLSLLSLLKHMTVMQNNYTSLLSACQPSYKAKFSAILNTLQDTTSKALENFVTNLKNEGDKLLPKDGTVHELTSNTLVFVEQLVEFGPTLAPILASNEEMPKRRDKAKYMLGLYIYRVLSHLGLALVQRSASYSDPMLCAIFRLNNYNYILKSLYSSELIQILMLATPDCANTYTELIREQRKLYSESLRKLLSFLDPSDDIPLSLLLSGKLKDKDRQVIKDKFSGFNRELEEMQKVQRGYSIPDLELRESIKRDNKELILPRYQHFFDKYSQVSFSKSSDKYVKYTPADVSNKLDEFFDVAA